MNHHDLDKFYCSAIKRGEVFLIETEHEESLVVVVQDNILNERLATVLAVPIVPHHEPGPVYKNELLLKPSETSLGSPAVCLAHKLYPVNRHYIRAKTGELEPERLQELFEKIDINFGRFRDK